MKTMFILVQNQLILYPYSFNGSFDEFLQEAWSLLTNYNKVIILIPRKSIQIELYNDSKERTATIMQEDKIIADYINPISKYKTFRDLIESDLNM